MVSRSRSGIRRTRSGSGIRRTRSVSGNRRSRSANSGARPSQIRSRSRSRAAWNHLKRHRLAYGSGAVLLGAGAAGGAYVLTRPRLGNVPVIGRANQAARTKVSRSNLAPVDPRGATRSGTAQAGGFRLKNKKGFRDVFGPKWGELMEPTEAAWKKVMNNKGLNTSGW